MPAEERRPAEKAAAVISMLGTERASEVFRYLTENEVEQLSMEITRLPHLAPDEMEDIAKDFYNCCVTEKVITEGGKDYAKEVLEKAFGQQQARNLMDRVSKALKTKAFSFIRKVDYKTLMTAIQNEHPQTLALILSYATPEQASKIIANLPQETRVDVVERIAGKTHSVKLEVVPGGMYVPLPIVPNCIYTNPEIATVGITAETARASGLKVRCGHFSMRDNGKSIITGEEHGFIRLVFEAYSNTIIGAQMMCPRATDMIGEMATAAANKLTVPQLLLGMRAHPTYNEAVGEALEELEGGSIHTVPRQAPGKLKSRQ